MKTFWSWLVELDRILRGDATRVADLKDGSIKIPLGGVSLVLVLLGMIYGLCMAVFVLIMSDNRMQLVASAVKVPALFLLTLLVTLPSLYVFNALVGSRLTVASLLRLFVAALAVNLAVLSSLGPIVAFFALNTTSYNFMVLLNVLVFALSGVLGLTFLLQTLHRLNIASLQERAPWGRTEIERWLAAGRKAGPAAPTAPAPAAPAPAVASAGGGPLGEGAAAAEPPAAEPRAVPAAGAAPDSGGAPPAPGHVEGLELIEPDVVDEEGGPLDPIKGHVLGHHTRLIFNCWVIVFGLVGAQMSWVLRPFIGDPSMEFEWLRPRGSNFFEAVWHALRSLLS